MAETLEQLKGQLEQHSAEDKAELPAAWGLEIARRVDEIRNGRASGTSAEEVFAELRREFP